MNVQCRRTSMLPGSYPSNSTSERRVEAFGTDTRSGGSAIVWAATRVKSEQVSKGWKRVQSPLSLGECRRNESDLSIREEFV